jgi:hypothetical protein
VVRAIIMGDREYIEPLLSVVKPEENDILVVSRGPIPGLPPGRILQARTQLVPSASRGEFARALEDIIGAIEEFGHVDYLIADVGPKEYSSIASMIAKLSRSSLLLFTTLSDESIALLKELSLLSREKRILVVSGKHAPRSTKLNKLIVETLLRLEIAPGVYTLRVKRYKSYLRAWLWYHEALDTVRMAREVGVPEYLVLDLETRVREAERLLKGSRYTQVYPAIYDVKLPSREQVWSESPQLFPAPQVEPLEPYCYASQELVIAGNAPGCEGRDYLNEEIIVLWPVLLKPLLPWEKTGDEALDSHLSRYNSKVEENPLSLHPWSTTIFWDELKLPWSLVPIYTLSPEKAGELCSRIGKELDPLHKLTDIAMACQSEDQCIEAIRISHNLEETIRAVVENFKKLRGVVLLAKELCIRQGYRDTLGVRIGVGWRLEELQELIALVKDIIEIEGVVDPQLLDNLASIAPELAETLYTLYSPPARH